MPHIRTGRILFVDLTTRITEIWPVDRYSDFIGGRGIHTKILYDMVGPEVRPLDPANVIAFGAGPLAGTFAPGSGRTEVTSKSPMTGLLGMSSMGGYFAAELRHSGYDNLVITGKSPKPCYLYITNDGVQIQNASSVWGQDTYSTPGIIRRELDEPDAQVISIGQAGENLVRYACIVGKVGDAAGKTGMGCVMGSKNLKAIAVRGTAGVKLAQPEKFLSACEEAHRAMRASPAYEAYLSGGTPAGMDSSRPVGTTVAGNHQTTRWEHSDKVRGLLFLQSHRPKRAGCFGCPLRCMEQYSVPGIGNGVVSCAGYTQTTFQIRNSDMDMWWETVVLSQRYGLDLMSLSGMLGWAMEMYERGIIDSSDTGGIAMLWGEREATVDIIEKVAYRKSFGDVLADNVFEATAKVGRDSARYMMHIKGLHMYAVNQMNYRAEALAGAVGPRGDRIRGTTLPVTGGAAKAKYYSATDEELEERIRPLLQVADNYGAGRAGLEGLSYDGKAALVSGFEETIVVPDLLGLCKWHSEFERGVMTVDLDAMLYEAGTGQAMTADTLRLAAKRVRTLERAYDCREGLTRDDDMLPERFFTTPMAGVFPDDVLDRQQFENMKDEYYALKGWDVATGVPTRDTLESYGLESVAGDLERVGKLPTAVTAEVVAPAAR